MRPTDLKGTLNRLRRRLDYRIFNRNVRDVLNLPKVPIDPDSDFVLVTQLISRDILLYLLALHSFTKYLRPARFFVIGDRLSREDIELLHQHVDGITVLNAADRQSAVRPHGGCWERLSLILELSRDYYVIQLDSDTLTLGHPSEVARAIHDNVSFTLVDNEHRQIVTFEEAAAEAERLPGESQHVQRLAELALRDLDGAGERLYVRGNAAFAGFARGQFTDAALDAFSDKMRNALGSAKWQQWGSEQVASNYLIANAQDALTLPFDRYRLYRPGCDLSDVILVHFMGTHRFADGAYLGAARRLLAAASTETGDSSDIPIP